MGRTACTVELYLYSPYGPYSLVRSLSACTVELYLYSPFGPYSLVQSLSACTVELYLYSPYGPYSLVQSLSACTVELYLYSPYGPYSLVQSLSARRLSFKCDGTRAETWFRLSTKWTSPLKSAWGVSTVYYWQASCAHQPAEFVLLVQACVLQSCDAYWLPIPFHCFPFTSPPLRHLVPSHFNWTLQGCTVPFLFALNLPVFGEASGWIENNNARTCQKTSEVTV
jgi:hypothetical protein